MNKDLMLPVVGMQRGISGRPHFKEAHTEILYPVFFAEHHAAHNIFYFFTVHDSGQNIFVIDYFHLVPPRFISIHMFRIDYGYLKYAFQSRIVNGT